MIPAVISLPKCLVIYSLSEQASFLRTETYLGRVKIKAQKWLERSALNPHSAICLSFTFQTLIHTVFDNIQSTNPIST